jgi:ketosteroid isomerase-like protein
MTEVSQRQRTAESAAAVVTELFDRYRAHDVDGMTDLCSINADFSYIRAELWGKQRVLRGYGKVCTVGKPLWTGLIASFRNLSNAVHSVTSNDEVDVVAQVDVEGTQQLAWGLIAPAGRHYCEPHLFIFHVGADLLIDSITAYWNDAGISRRLGHDEVD